MSFVSEVTAGDGDEVRVVLGGEDRQRMSDDREDDARDPKLQTKSECRGQCAIDDGK